MSVGSSFTTNWYESQEEVRTDPKEAESHSSVEQVKGCEDEFSQRNKVGKVFSVCGAITVAFQGTRFAILWTRLPR